MRDDLEIGRVRLWSDHAAVWLECGECGAVILDTWGTPIDLRALVSAAQDHVCGLTHRDHDDE